MRRRALTRLSALPDALARAEWSAAADAAQPDLHREPDGAPARGDRRRAARRGRERAARGPLTPRDLGIPFGLGRGPDPRAGAGPRGAAQEEVLASISEFSWLSTD